ncbi:unnamed protein product [Lactuca virosa]|uniref:Replication protein A OB domain-containing protein n=1 Tax=Lactuca virosa TaxID=75947 RepID=A0AAU9LUU8_9ASTR|nr:unnamed protein product [Lactuca virosa]
MFTDTRGTKVSALIISDYLEFFKNTFQVYKHYHISNAKLLPTEPIYRLGPYEHSSSLTKKTLVEPEPELTSPTLPCLFNFTPFSEMFKYADAKNNQNVRGVVIKCFPSQQMNQGGKTSSKRDVIIVNEEKKLLLLTLWDSFDDNEGKALEEITHTAPMIFAIRVKITTFYGLSLSTANGSSILINPPVSADQRLDNWFQQNSKEINCLLQRETYEDTDILLPHPKEEDIHPIAIASARIENVSKPKWVKGTLNLPHQDRSFTQTGCANCLKPVEADVSWIIKCPACKTESKVRIMLRATISTPDIETFISFNPNAVRDAEENGEDVHDKITASIQSLSVVAFVRSNQTHHKQKTTTRFVIVKAHKLQQPYTQNQQQIKTSNPTDPQSSTKPSSPKQTHKRHQPENDKSKEIETSAPIPSRPTKKIK